MKIQQYKTFEFKSQFNIYYSFGNSHFQNPILHVERFLHNAYWYIYRAGGPVPFLNNLCIGENGNCGTGFNMIEFNADMKNNVIYIGEIFDSGDLNMTEEEFNNKFSNMTSLQLCQNKIIDGALMSKDNFIHLLTEWGKLFDVMSPFILLYLDDKDWYDVLPFDSQEAMEKFVADHTQSEPAQK